jgi:succinylarginine dihydrolase
MIQMGTPIDGIQVYDLRESMRNGGGVLNDHDNVYQPID